MLEQQQRKSVDRRQGQAIGRKPPFSTRDGIVYADRRVQPDRRLIGPIMTLIPQNSKR
jgi:hypothetical protein